MLRSIWKTPWKVKIFSKSPAVSLWGFLLDWILVVLWILGKCVWVRAAMAYPRDEAKTRLFAREYRVVF